MEWWLVARCSRLCCREREREEMQTEFSRLSFRVFPRFQLARKATQPLRNPSSPSEAKCLQKKRKSHWPRPELELRHPRTLAISKTCLLALAVYAPTGNRSLLIPLPTSLRSHTVCTPKAAVDSSESRVRVCTPKAALDSSDRLYGADQFPVLSQ
eukprot:567436-Rhodomonas_salina.1